MNDDWPRCRQCGGACIAGGKSCLAHAVPEERAAALEHFSKGGGLDVRGVTISEALLKEILDAASRNTDGHPTFSAVQFHGATFDGNAKFNGVTFKGDADFVGATFKGDTRFAEATFNGGADFGGATFERYAGFDGAIFERYARFDGAIFEGYAAFRRATFKGDALFLGATIEDHLRFDGAIFEGYAGFMKATFEGDVAVLGLITVAGLLNLDEVQFASQVRIVVDAGVLNCRRGRFPGGVQFDVQRAVMRLDDTDLSAPSLLTGRPVSGPAEAVIRPRLLSLQRANVAGLTLGGVGLADCRFAGAHNLDKLKVEADTVLGLSPAVASWERRQIIAEERAWRAARTRPGRWGPPSWPDPEDPPKPLSPGAIAGLYRALRKGREDAKDEPSAADFYYGEMEMRRHDRNVGDAEWRRGREPLREVLTAYWLVSGYGQRAWRTLAALAVVTALFAVAFHYVGFITPPKPASYWTSLLYTFRSTISLTDSQVVLTAWGSFFQALLRITGPVLLGLALLANVLALGTYGLVNHRCSSTAHDA